MILEKEFKDFKNFIFFLRKKKLSGINLFLTTLIIFFLPAPGYYSSLQLNWQPPAVSASHFVIPKPPPYPKNITGVEPPFLTARASLVVDVPSGVVIYAKNENLRLLPASTTKIMTALVALEFFAPDQVLEVPRVSYEGQDIKLIPGEKMTVENLLYALLVASANDAAQVLAKNYPGGETAFVSKMNEKAESLFFKNSHFINPTGIDDYRQYSTAADLSQLAKYALENPTFAKIVATQKVAIYSIDQKIVHPMSNVNILLERLPGIKGIKTGWTVGAGECLVGFIEREGRKIITVVLGSGDRFGETERLIDWVFGNFEWFTPTPN